MYGRISLVYSSSHVIRLSGRSVADDEDLSDAETEDSDAVELTEEREAEFLRALALVKSNDPILYKKDVKLFSEDTDADAGVFT